MELEEASTGSRDVVCDGEVQTLPPAAGDANRRGQRWRSLAVTVRRTHMYVALFVTPWLAMYALSTLVFNHFGQVNRLYEKIYGPHFDKYLVERQFTYTKTFPAHATLRTRAEQILKDLNLDGSFGVARETSRLVITRRDPFTPRRILYSMNTHMLTIERQKSLFSTFLTTLHTQVTYTNKLKRVKAWAALVDLTIATMIVLVFSGVWMWWELKVTRFAGLVFMAVGVALFCIFVFLA